MQPVFEKGYPSYDAVNRGIDTMTMTDQQIEEMHSGVPEVRPAGTWQREELPSPTPPPSPPSDRVAELSESARCLKFD